MVSEYPRRGYAQPRSRCELLRLVWSPRYCCGRTNDVTSVAIVAFLCTSFLSAQRRSFPSPTCLPRPLKSSVSQSRPFLSRQRSLSSQRDAGLWPQHRCWPPARALLGVPARFPPPPPPHPPPLRPFLRFLFSDVTDSAEAQLAVPARWLRGEPRFSRRLRTSSRVLRSAGFVLRAVLATLLSANDRFVRCALQHFTYFAASTDISSWSVETPF